MVNIASKMGSGITGNWESKFNIAIRGLDEIGRTAEKTLKSIDNAIGQLENFDKVVSEAVRMAEEGKQDEEKRLLRDNKDLLLAVRSSVTLGDALANAVSDVFVRIDDIEQLPDANIPLHAILEKQRTVHTLTAVGKDYEGTIMDAMDNVKSFLVHFKGDFKDLTMSVEQLKLAKEGDLNNKKKAVEGVYGAIDAIVESRGAWATAAFYLQYIGSDADALLKYASQ